MYAERNWARPRLRIRSRVLRNLTGKTSAPPCRRQCSHQLCQAILVQKTVEDLQGTALIQQLLSGACWNVCFQAQSAVDAETYKPLSLQRQRHCTEVYVSFKTMMRDSCGHQLHTNCCCSGVQCLLGCSCSGCKHTKQEHFVLWSHGAGVCVCSVTPCPKSILAVAAQLENRLSKSC